MNGFTWSRKESKSPKNFEDVYFSSIEKIRKNPEYIQNKMQIDVIRKTLIETVNVPEQLVDWLVESVQENTAMEYELINSFLLNSKKA